MIAAILTIVGYSVNDTIVIYDRIRENTQLPGKQSFSNLANLSVNQCLSRSLWTAGTTFMVTMVLAIWGGVAIADFGWAMSIGLISGTWSTNFIATPFVVWWDKRFGLNKHQVTA